MSGDNYQIKDLYQGGSSSLNKNYGSLFTGYRINAGELGASTNPQTANQIQEIGKLINQGIVPVELGSMDPKTFQSIPKDHFKELNQLAKLTGAKVSIHAPIQNMDPSGIGQQGWSEASREAVERQLFDVVDKAVEIENKGGTPIVIHGSNAGGTTWKIDDEGKKVIDQMLFIDRETGQINALKEDIHYRPSTTGVKEERKTPEQKLDMHNNTKWHNEIDSVIFKKDNADKIIQNNYDAIKHWHRAIMTRQLTTKQIEDPNVRQMVQQAQTAHAHLEDSEQTVNSLFTRAYKIAKEDDNKKRIKELEKISSEYAKERGMVSEKEHKEMSQDELIKMSEKQIDLRMQSEAIHRFADNLKNLNPNSIIKVEDFEVQQAKKTFANVALHAVELAKKKGIDAPKIAIENMYPGMGFTMGDEMDALITASKEEFVELATKKGMSKSEAQTQADKVIGMTLDVGHLNIAKKHGFTDKDILKEVDKMAPHVKHIHLTDNFGYEDSHLAPGMGNVPFKKILEKLEKSGTLKEARKIVEAGGVVQHFKQSPLLSTLEGMGSSIYTDGSGPYWSKSQELYQNYSGGMGMMLPQKHYSMFGAGFSQLPAELGGQIPGGQGGGFGQRGME